MVIWPEISMRQYRKNNHREDAPHFIIPPSYPEYNLKFGLVRNVFKLFSWILDRSFIEIISIGLHSNFEWIAVECQFLQHWQIG